jgi:hypothetical protein
MFSFLFIFQLDGFCSTPLSQEIELLHSKEENNSIIGAGLSTLFKIQQFKLIFISGIALPEA